VELQWATYFDAADQAGVSRIYGGIHPPIDDASGRRSGYVCGHDAWALANTYFDGSARA
jgi:membrane-associated phospholipid phosphatase